MHAVLEHPYGGIQPCPAILQIQDHFADIACPFQLGQVLELQLKGELRSYIPMGSDARWSQDSSVLRQRDDLCAGIAQTMDQLTAPRGSVAVTPVAVDAGMTPVAIEMENYRESWTVQHVKDFCRSSKPAYSVGLVGSSGNVGTFGVTRAGFRPRFASEIDSDRQLLYEDLSGGI